MKNETNHFKMKAGEPAPMQSLTKGQLIATLLTFFAFFILFPLAAFLDGAYH